MPRGRLVLGAALAAVAGVEAWGVTHPGQHYTITELTRTTFRVHTGPGRRLFATALGGTAAWFLFHIIDHRALAPALPGDAP